MGKEWIISSMATITKATTRMESQMGLECILGPMEVSIQAISKMDSSSAKASGGKHLNKLEHLLMNTMGNIIKIRSVAMASSSGLQAILTKETIKMTRGTAMERCVGLMAASTLGSG